MKENRAQDEGLVEQPYSPEFVETRLREAGAWRALWRILQILSVLLAGLLWRTIDGWPWTYRRGETVEDRQRRRAEWLLGRLTWLGPAFVKVGQSLGTRPDLLPLAYLEVLSALHDRLPSFPDEVAYALIEEELGWRPQTLFQAFESESFAAASLGQVYRAVTFEGEEVAVKVQRPDLLQLISLDLALVRRLAGYVERWPRLSRGQDWVGLVDEFGGKLFEELDYVHEAAMTERFRANFAAAPGIYGPRVHREYSSRRVLTTEYIDGIKITEKAALEIAGVDIPALLSRGVRANLEQLFVHGLFHADPHPGNLLVRCRPDEPLEHGTLVFIDFGMMGVIRPEEKGRLIEIFVDVINRRPENLRENLVALGFLRPDARWEELMPLANDLFRSLFGSAEGPHSFQDVTHAFAPLLYEYEFRIPVDFAYIVRAIMTLEGISRQLDPDFDIFAVSAPYAARVMLTFPDPSLRRRLMDELLVEDGSVDWERLEQLVAVAARGEDGGFRLETEGLVGPALDMLLSPEGEDLRHALLAELLEESARGGAGTSATRLEGLGKLLRADASLSGRAILDRVVGFALSPEGAGTRAQLAAGLQGGHNGAGRSAPGSGGGFDLARAVDLASRAGRLHPDFGAGTVIRSVGSYLFSEQGKPVRDQLVSSGVQRLASGLVRGLERLSRAAAGPEAKTETQVAGPEVRQAPALDSDLDEGGSLYQPQQQGLDRQLQAEQSGGDGWTR